MQLGVFGGSFDPIHWGHLVLAEEARLAAGLDRILFLPAGRPPHKIGRSMTSYEHRLAMVRLAVADAPEFEVSDLEGSTPGPHYTFETLESLRATRPGVELAFLLGSDSLLDLPGWRRPDRILELARLVVLPRPGFDPAAAPAGTLRHATLVDGVRVDVSSTIVRARLASGHSARYLVPGPVRDYIRAHALYPPA